MKTKRPTWFFKATVITANIIYLTPAGSRYRTTSHGSLPASRQVPSVLPCETPSDPELYPPSVSIITGSKGQCLPHGPLRIFNLYLNTYHTTYIGEAKDMTT